MRMKIIITESQKIRIFESKILKKLDMDLQILRKNVEEILSEIKKSTKINFSFLLTWGVGVYGVMGALNQFVEGEFPTLSNSEIAALITAGTMIFFNTKNQRLTELESKIEEMGLTDEMEIVKDKSTELKDTFTTFMGDVLNTTKELGNITAYSFLIPIIPLLFELEKQGMSNEGLQEVVSRLISFGVTIASNEILFKLLKKVQSKLRN